jgi:hypothetical protein
MSRRGDVAGVVGIRKMTNASDEMRTVHQRSIGVSARHRITNAASTMNPSARMMAIAQRKTIIDP